MFFDSLTFWTVVKHRGAKKRKMKNKISAFSLDFLSIGPSINGTPSDELLVLDLKKGQDCISSSALPVPISNRGHLHPFLGRYIG